MVLGIRFCLFVKEGHKLAKDREIPRRWRVDTLVGHYKIVVEARLRCGVRIDGTICIGGVGGVVGWGSLLARQSSWGKGGFVSPGMIAGYQVLTLFLVAKRPLVVFP